jgi:uncharacterized membrane protein YphA (DoxX/SURF4 family)
VQEIWDRCTIGADTNDWEMKRGDPMDTAVTIIQIVVALGIFNVWLLRFGRSTDWRGGAATNMKEEFQVYGLPGWSMQVVGFLKLLFAVCLIVGIWLQPLTRPAAVGLAILMLGAVAMHIKVKDPLKKSLPALTMLVLSVIVAAS